VRRWEPYRYDDWLLHREDISDLRAGSGAQLFCFYRDVISLRKREKALISPNVDIVHVHDGNRVLAYRRWLGDAEFLIAASLNNVPFDNGYRIASASLTAGAWIEALNSDDESYGGRGIRNRGVLASASLPACQRHSRLSASIAKRGERITSSSLPAQRP
jgi:1,4-alpha-glucan branching enzyme